MLRVLVAAALLAATPMPTAGDVLMRTQAAIAPAFNFVPFPAKGGTGITIAIIGKGPTSAVATALRARLEMYDVSKTEPDVYSDAEIEASPYDEASLI
jgi:hypothetical protein